MPAAVATAAPVHPKRAPAPAERPAPKRASGIRIFRSSELWTPARTNTPAATAPPMAPGRPKAAVKRPGTPSTVVVTPILFRVSTTSLRPDNSDESRGSEAGADGALFEALRERKFSATATLLEPEPI